MPEITPETINPALVVAHARAWIGTPFMRRAACRGAGVDCVGLLRGLHAELCGAHVPAPPWRDDWVLESGDSVLQGLLQHAAPAPGCAPGAGDILPFRLGRDRLVHATICTGSGVIHASDPAGVRETPPLTPHRRPAAPWRFLCPEGCETGPAGITPEDCLAVIYPGTAGPYAEISHQVAGTPLARSAEYAGVHELLNMLAPIYPFIETME